MEAASFLRLLQVFDSQFPVGAFVHSGGLETYAHLRFEREDLSELLLNQIRLGWGRLDLAALCLGWRCYDDEKAIETLCDEIHAYKVIPGQRSSSLRLGRRTIKLLDRLFPEYVDGCRMALPHQAVVAGVFGRRVSMPERELALAFAQSMLSASLAAATRAMQLSPGQAQEILTELQPTVIEQVDAVRRDPTQSLFSATAALDVRCHQQTYLATRLFQS